MCSPWDLHAGQIQGFFDIPVDHLYASPVLIKAIRDRGLDDVVVVSPDVGGIKMSHAYAKTLGAPLAIVAKNRISADEVEALSIIGDGKAVNVLLMDDLTESAGTLTAAANLLADHGAKNIYAGVSHAVLSDRGRERLAASPIIEVFATNSVPQAHGPKVLLTTHRGPTSWPMPSIGSIAMSRLRRCLIYVLEWRQPALLTQLHPTLRKWVGKAFVKLTHAQEITLPQVLEGRSVLLTSPTGSGKTLAGFLGVLHALLHDLDRGPLPDGIHRVCMSPLRALTGYDMQVKEPCRASGRNGIAESHPHRFA